MNAEQEVVRIRGEVMGLYQTMQLALREYAFNAPTDPKARKIALFDYQTKATDCFNSAENFVGNSELLGARKSPHWAQGYAEDCYALLEAMPEHFYLLRLEYKNLELSPTASCEPGATAFANMQRIVSQYLPDRKKSLYSIFKHHKLPVYGFEHKAKDLMNSDKKWAFIFGVAFVSIMILIALFVSQPSPFQYFVFRTVLALAGAGVGARLPGFIGVKVKGFLRAGGALALFALVYFWNPAALVI
ncbi:hypothetical protein [Pseudomonas syringae]|uniref:hypothetical protein n=1 Tax=Pseudomonas syringae TaxID=317 RepID=UPI00070EC303|nr:hypothetical protein [Pseudomonas syringae]KWS33230.1 hypothetical protein AL060_05245 [Pseudomonas syringae pv. rhaphiolepidis]